MTVRKILFIVCFLAVGSSAAQESFDVLIQGGRIVDGSGNPWYEADVGIRGERVVAIGNLTDASAARVIDASGLVVSPAAQRFFEGRFLVVVRSPMARRIKKVKIVSVHK